MKRIGNLYEKIISVENLKMADEMARRGKKLTYGVALHDKNREANITNLHLLLEKGEYKTSSYSIFKIYEPKEREVYRLPYYPDRIVHWAIMLQMESIWVSVFTADTFSCIKGRGIHGSAKKVVRVLQNDPDGTRYCLKLDVRKFYPSIDQDILMSLVARKIKCKRTLALLDEIFHSIPCGVPIGNYLSQFGANLYLTYFDHWIKEVNKVKYYFRYCDDIVILSSSKEQLHIWLSEIHDYFNQKLKLQVKNNQQIFPVACRGIDFVGYRFYHTHVLLRKGIKQNLMRKFCMLKKLGIKGKEFKRQMAAYWGWVSQPFASTRHLVKSIINYEKVLGF